MDFGKALLMQKIPESTDDSFLDSKFCTLLYISQRKRTQIQFCFQRGIHFPFVNGYRHWFRWLWQNGYGTQADFKSMRCTLLFCHNAGHTNGIFFLQFFQRNIRNAIFINGLQKPLALSQNHKRHIAHVSDFVNCTIYRYFFSLILTG